MIRNMAIFSQGGAFVFVFIVGIGTIFAGMVAVTCWERRWAITRGFDLFLWVLHFCREKHIFCHLGRVMELQPLVPWPPIRKIPFDHDNSRSNIKVKGTPVSAAPSWPISLVLHIRASYRLLSLAFHDNRPSHSRDHENSRSKVKVIGTLVSVASSWLISILFHIN